MTKKQRIRAAVEKKRPDRLPYSLWTHLPGIDLDPQALANATCQFYKDYDVDIIKMMSNGMYAVEDFGCKVDFPRLPPAVWPKLPAPPSKTRRIGAKSGRWM